MKKTGVDQPASVIRIIATRRPAGLGNKEFPSQIEQDSVMLLFWINQFQQNWRYCVQNMKDRFYGTVLFRNSRIKLNAI